MFREIVGMVGESLDHVSEFLDGRGELGETIGELVRALSRRERWRWYGEGGREVGEGVRGESVAEGRVGEVVG